MNPTQGRDDGSLSGRVRVAVVGCGGWAQGWHLRNLSQRDDASIVALVDPATQPGVGGCLPGTCESMPDLQEKYGCRWYKSMAQLIQEREEGIIRVDGVVIAVRCHQTRSVSRANYSRPSHPPPHTHTSSVETERILRSAVHEWCRIPSSVSNI